VKHELDKNPLLTPKQLCFLCRLPYAKYADYVSHIKTEWKYDSKRQRGSIPSIHAWRGWTYLPDSWMAMREEPKRWVAVGRLMVSLGWLKTKARNRWLLWKDRIGRLQYFPSTGRVNLYVRKPATWGRAYQLVCNGWFNTGLISDVKDLEECLRGIRFKSAHYVFETSGRLPMMTIELFGKSNGVIIKVGDRTHPHGIEVLASYPDWGEKNERLFSELIGLLRENRVESPKKPTGLKRDLSYVS